MRILVTGGAGFIGSAFLFLLRRLRPDARLICLDALTYAGNAATLAPLTGTEGFRFVHGNICDRALLDALFEEERPDAVVNFAAESHVDRAIDSPEIFLQTNVLGTAALLDACRTHGNIRFHQVSTDEVYGALPIERPELRFTEESPLRPNNPYAASKASADLLTLSYHRTYGLPVTVSRCSNNYGPHQFPEKLIPLMITNALQGRELPVYGDGMQVRDWIHTEDHCRAILRILEDGAPGEVYNIGADCERTNLSIVRQICAQLAIPEARIAHVTDRPGHDRRYGIDAGKLRETLGWTPQVGFEEGLSETIGWYREHPEWWSVLK